MQVEAITLSGTLVRLEPLQAKHATDLYEAGQDERIWRYMPVKLGQSVTEMQNWIASTLKLQESGTILPFAIIDRGSERAIGSTRYHDIQEQNRGLEIGWTWLTPQVQRTGVNTECKYLLLQHAFEHLGAIRVQLKTDSRNLQSQRAIERIGAIKEGVLRNHMIMWDGYYRHSVYYSVIESEWPGVKAGLAEKMGR
jgi:RimJ/RimL family protein N-acetyltransferase